MKKGLLGVGVVLAGLVGLAVSALMWGVGKNNAMVAKRNAMDAQWAQVQSVYQRRADLIPNLVQTVQGAANFEKSTLQEVVNARASVGQVNLNTTSAPDNPQTLQKFHRQNHIVDRAFADEYTNLTRRRLFRFRNCMGNLIIVQRVKKCFRFHNSPTASSSASAETPSTS